MVPNFNYTDLIQRYIDAPDGLLLTELRELRESHPKKFIASLRWALGDGATFGKVEKETRQVKGQAYSVKAEGRRAKVFKIENNAKIEARELAQATGASVGVFAVEGKKRTLVEIVVPMDPLALLREQKAGLERKLERVNRDIARLEE